jgi:hypothetical protein
MSLIERWWRIDFHDHSEWTSNEENARDASEHYDYPVAGPFVLEAQQPQGAVEDRDRYWQALVDIAGHENWEPKTMGDIARAALDPAEGQ